MSTMNWLVARTRRIAKEAAFRVLGQRTAQSLARRVRGQVPTFAESQAVFDYFRLAPRKGTLVDVGAHFGESFAPYLECGWRVIAMEPDPANRRALVDRGLDRGITLIPHAVSDKELDSVPFYASSESTGISSLSAFRPTHQEVAQVRVLTLRRIVEDHNLSNVDFLKIDTEGHDLFVLKGFPWEQIHPEIVLCEFEDYKTRPLGYTYHDLGRFLLGQQYTVYLSEWYPIVRYGGDHRWRRFVRYPVDVVDQRAWGNLVAVSGAAAVRYFDRLTTK